MSFLDTIRPFATAEQLETLQTSLRTGEPFDATPDFTDLYCRYTAESHAREIFCPDAFRETFVGQRTALEFAFYADREAAASILDDSGDTHRGRVDIGEGLLTPLMCAVEKGRMDRVDQLLSLGADPNYSGGDNFVTPLMYAASLADIDIARRLLDTGANPAKVLKDSGFSVLNSYCSSDVYVPGMVEMLILHGAPADQPLFFGAAMPQVLEDLKNMGIPLATHTDEQGRDLFLCAWERLRSCVGAVAYRNREKWYDRSLAALRFCQENGMARDGFDLEAVPPCPTPRDVLALRLAARR